MARPLRIQFEGAHYHVFSRGNRREQIFLREEDYAAFEYFLLAAAGKSDVKLYNWSQLPNHFHFNVATPEGNLANFMQRLLSRYARYFNRVHQTVGHVFQGRYGARHIDKECHFKEILRYVELNPYRLKKGTLAELGHWKWTSLRYYLSSVDQWPEVCKAAFSEVLEHFGTEPVTARQNLAQFLADGLAAGTWEDFYRVKDHRFVGDGPFIEELKQKILEPIRQTPRDLPATMTFPELLAQVGILSGLSIERLTATDQIRLYSRWRKVFAYVASRFYRIPVLTIAKVLNRDATTVSHMIRSTDASRDRFPEIAQLLTVLQTEEVQR